MGIYQQASTPFLLPQGTLRVIAADDAALTEYFDLVREEEQVTLKPKGKLRIPEMSAGTADLSRGALLIRYYEGPGDPALVPGEIAAWTNTSIPACFIGVHVPGTGIKKVQLA